MFLAGIAAWLLLFCGYLEPPLLFFVESGENSLHSVLRGNPDENVSVAGNVKARALSPAGNPATWVTENDYPQEAIANGWHGEVSFRLDVNADGRVVKCSVTKSSTHTVLDEKACSTLTERARFDPARDAAGEPIASTFASRLAWKFPEGGTPSLPVSF